MTKVPKVVKIISILGLLPFIFGAIASLQLSLIEDTLNKFFLNFSILYSALILSFLGGCLFGFECLSKSVPNKKRVWIAILPTLWAILALQITNFSASILAIGFLLVYEVDRKAYAAGTVPYWWLSLRLPLTAIVILSLSIIGFSHAS